MPLYIRDERVNDLAGKLAASVGLSKTDAVRLALETQIELTKRKESLSQRLGPLRTRAKKLGLHPDGVDDKELMDDLSGGL